MGRLMRGAPGPCEGGPTCGLPFGGPGDPYARGQGGPGDPMQGGGGSKAPTNGTHTGKEESKLKIGEKVKRYKELKCCWF